MSETTTAPDEPFVWAVAGLVVFAFGVAEWVVPSGSSAGVPLPDVSEDGGGHPVDNLYGLTPADVARLADTLVERASHDTRFVVAGYPGPRRLNGPLLTRSTAARQMPRDGAADRLAGRPLEQGWRQLTVENRENPRRKPLLSGASVSVEADGERRTCARLQLERFACARPGWSHVRRKKVQVDGNATSCIWSHPLEDRRIVVDFGPIDTRPDAGPYRVRTALDDSVADEPGDVDVDLRVGKRRIDHRHRAQKGWQKAPPLEIEGAAPLSVAVSAERVGRRHFCFTID